MHIMKDRHQAYEYKQCFAQQKKWWLYNIETEEKVGVLSFGIYFVENGCKETFWKWETISRCTCTLSL